MKVSELKEGYHMFGNKGTVWSNSAHIAKSGHYGNTMCGTPMLSTNWARIEKLEEVRCPDCLKIYNEEENK
jgi:hypothetical protein